MSNTTSSIKELNLGPSYGPILIGALLEAALWGMTTVQTVLYFINYGSKDRWYLKSVVLINFALTSTLVIAISSGVYLPLILHFGNALQLRNYPWGIRAAGLLSATTIFHIQSFFLVRVYRFSQSILPLIVAVPFVLTTFALGLVSDVQVIHDPNRAAASAKLGNINVACEAVMSATDFLLAALLVFFLRKKEPKLTRETPTNVVVERIIKYSIGTGALTGVLALIGVIIHYAATPSIGNAIFAAIPHTYSNAMLIILNTRKLVTKPWNGNVAPSNDMSTLQFHDPVPHGRTTWEDPAFHSQTKIEHDLESSTMLRDPHTKSGSQSKSAGKGSVEESIHVE